MKQTSDGTILVEKQENLDVSCIYRIRNVQNGKIYIGSAVNFRKRRNVHLYELRKNKHHSSKLQRAFNKYGEDSFVFEIVECVEDVNKLIEREQFHLDNTNAVKDGYNITSVAGNILGFRMSSESRQKMKNSHKERLKKLSKEDLKRMYGTTLCTHFSEDMRKKISDGRKGKGGKSVRCIELNKVFDDFPDAGKFINKTSSCIHRAVNGLQKTAGGYHWEYFYG